MLWLSATDIASLDHVQPRNAFGRNDIGWDVFVFLENFGGYCSLFLGIGQRFSRLRMYSRFVFMFFR